MTVEVQVTLRTNISCECALRNSIAYSQTREEDDLCESDLNETMAGYFLSFLVKVSIYFCCE